MATKIEPATVQPSVRPLIWFLSKGAICECAKLRRGTVESRTVQVADTRRIGALRESPCISEIHKAERRLGAYLIYGRFLIGRLQLVM